MSRSTLTSVLVRPGQATAIVGRRGVGLVALASDDVFVARLSEVLDADGGMDDVLAVLAEHGLSELPSFGFVFDQERGIRAISRGSVRVGVTAKVELDSSMLSGAGLRTWREVAVPGARAWSLQLADADTDADAGDDPDAEPIALPSGLSAAGQVSGEVGEAQDEASGADLSDGPAVIPVAIGDVPAAEPTDEPADDADVAVDEGEPVAELPADAADDVEGDADGDGDGDGVDDTPPALIPPAEFTPPEDAPPPGVVPAGPPVSFTAPVFDPLGPPVEFSPPPGPPAAFLPPGPPPLPTDGLGDAADPDAAETDGSETSDVPVIGPLDGPLVDGPLDDPALSAPPPLSGPVDPPSSAPPSWGPPVAPDNWASDDVDPDDDDWDDAADDRPRVELLLCDQGHANPPEAESCRQCGGGVDDTVYFLPRPDLGRLVFDSGRSVELSRPVIIGRNPPDDAEIDGEPATGVRVPDPEAVLSRQHLEVRLHGWDVVLVDKKSRNFTTITRPGESPERMLPGVLTEIPLGTRVVLADVATFVYEPPR